MYNPELTADQVRTPLVSVAITTYNSARWLPRALESVLEQQAEFLIEIVIGDDCSQDDTVSIAKSYREKYSGITILDRSKNVGIQRNYYETFEACKGKYIAWLDADDYWTDPEKITVQVRAMEETPSIQLCGHFVREVTSDGTVICDRYPARSPGRYGLEDVVRGLFMSTPSIVFRNGIQRDLPAWYFDMAPMTDKPIYMLAACAGDIVLLDRVMADYVRTPGSANTSKGELFWYQTDVRFYEYMESILPQKWHRLARSVKGIRYEAIAYLLRKQGNFTDSRIAAVKAFWAPALMDNVGSKTKALIAAVVREVEWRFQRKSIADGKGR
jgi:glycosyltransferase involved in cell wall biosynthesis